MQNATLPRGRGRPCRTTPDTRTENQKRLDRLAKRRKRGLEIAEALPRLPDGARIPLAAVEVVLNRSPATIWRHMKDGILPPLLADGSQRYYTARMLREVLAGSEQQ